MSNLRFEHIAIQENHDPMVDIADYPFIAAPAYFEQGYSDTPKLYTRQAIADRLVRLQDSVLRDYHFKIWDPWRSRIVQGNIYRQYWRELAVKNPGWDDDRLKQEVGVFVTAPDTPGRIPPHATGGSIDLTLIEKKSGHELDMGTGFDHFGAEAARNYFEQPGSDVKVRDNRRRLYAAMNEAGFTTDPDEWWHFDFGNQKWAVEAGLPSAHYGEVVNIDAALRKAR